jgi:hypothetical protein
MRGGRVVTNARRDAVDVDGVARRAAFFSRTAKPCGPGAPRLASSLQVTSLQATEAIKPGLRGEHGISRKPSRRECRRKRLTCGDLLVCFFHSHTRLRVRLAPGIPCALIISGGFDASLGRDCAAGMRRRASSCPRLSRASTSRFAQRVEHVDGRDKPGHDEGGAALMQPRAARMWSYIRMAV